MKKVCKQCGEVKSVSEFGSHSSSKDGYQGLCKTCNAKILEKARVRSLEVMTKKKICANCGKEKHVSKFNKHSQSKDNLQSWCKSCYAEYFANKRTKEPKEVIVYDDMSFAEMRNKIEELMCENGKQKNELAEMASMVENKDCDDCPYYEFARAEYEARNKELAVRDAMRNKIPTSNKFEICNDGTVSLMS